MARITGKNALFFVTSPRTPNLMVEELKLLVENFSGEPWNDATQKKYYTLLSQQDYFTGSAMGDIAFKARDRINRSPKALGLVDLNPVVSLTEPGKLYLYGPRPAEIFTKQLLKFQLDSPYHIDSDKLFSVKPYLEIIRLIRDLEGLTKSEIAIFGMQLINYKNYEVIKNKIIEHRKVTKIRNKNISYRAYLDQVFVREIREVYAKNIEDENIETRESNDSTLSNFISTKKRNHNDYADAAVRYLRATLLFGLDPLKNKITIFKDKLDEVNFICEKIDRNPYNYIDLADFKSYLFNPANIQLLTDDKNLLLSKITTIDASFVLGAKNVEVLKDTYEKLQANKLEAKLVQEVAQLQTYEDYDDLIEVFDKITGKQIVEPPLYFEWNTWRAFTMLNDGNIQGNFRVDDEGMPLYTAAGNMPDIVCSYSDFKVIVEVTLSSGQKQYEMEGEPVARHLGNIKRDTEQDVYCIFIAPTLSAATVAYYYSLHKISIAHYGGKAKIIPIQLDVFKGMLANAKAATVKPKSNDIRSFLETVSSYTDDVVDENAWLEMINNQAKTAFVSH